MDTSNKHTPGGYVPQRVPLASWQWFLTTLWRPVQHRQQTIKQELSSSWKMECRLGSKLHSPGVPNAANNSFSSEWAEHSVIRWLRHCPDMVIWCFALFATNIFSGLFIGEVRTWDSNASSRTSTRDSVGVYQTIDWYFVLMIISKIIYVLYGDKNDTPQKQIPVVCPGALRENAVDVR
jgi:hypothetical protein